MGRGVRTDYCRVVSRQDSMNREIDRFLSCDLASKGGFSYWFRSPTKSEGLPYLELPYAKSLTTGAFDSYCGVSPPTRTRPAGVACLSIAGLGFGAGTLPDPDPPSRVRVRLRTYENLLFWLPLVQREGTEAQGSVVDRIGEIQTRIEPVAKVEDGYMTSGGTPYLRTLSKPPINETNVFSMMLHPNSNSTSGSNEMILFVGDDAYMNEISIQKTITNSIKFVIYEGKAETFTMTSGNLTSGKWNHILLQYKNGYWYLFIDGLSAGKKMGSRHSFMKRESFFVSRPLPQHTQQGFNGKIADIRLYSRAMSKSGIKAIKEDFDASLHESGHSSKSSESP